jgi:hypothetical protein
MSILSQTGRRFVTVGLRMIAAADPKNEKTGVRDGERTMKRLEGKNAVITLDGGRGGLMRLLGPIEKGTFFDIY